MNCPHCSSNIANDAKFCPVCGKNVMVAAQAPQPQAPQQNFQQQGSAPNYGQGGAFVPQQNFGQMPPKKSKTGLIIALSAVCLILIGVIIFLLLSKDKTPKEEAVLPSHDVAVDATQEPVSTAQPTVAPTPMPTPEPTPVPILAPSYTAYTNSKADIGNRIYFTDSSASSEYSSGKGIRYAQYAIDDTAYTSWQEGVNGNGVGESLSLYFDGTYEISTLKFMMGHQSSKSVYEKNNRPVKIKAEFAGGNETIITFSDIMEAQYVHFDTAIKTDYITFTILEIEEGSEYEEACIAEIAAFSESDWSNDEPDFLGVHRGTYPDTAEGYNKFLNDFTGYVLKSEYKVKDLDSNCIYFCLHDEVPLVKIKEEYSSVLECYSPVCAYFYDDEILMMTEFNQETGENLMYYFDDGELTHYYITGDSAMHKEGDMYGDGGLQRMHNYMMEIYEDIED